MFNLYALIHPMLLCVMALSGCYYNCFPVSFLDGKHLISGDFFFFFLYL